MKVLYPLCCFICVLLHNDAVQAYFSPSHTETPYIEESKTKPNTEPKLSSENFLNISDFTETGLAVKYAGVSFIFNSKKNVSVDSNNTNLDTKPIEETKCPEGQENVGGICTDVAACKEAFPLSSADKGVGSYVTKNCGSQGIGYCYTSCQTGWKKSGCSCNAVDCSDYPLSTSSKTNCDGVKSCKTGNTYMYKCTGCAPGYSLNKSGVCVDKGCNDYGDGYLKTLTEHCSSFSLGNVGETYCYKCSACEDGWELSDEDYTCKEKTCSNKSSYIEYCTSGSITRTGTSLCYECTSCANGYSLNSDGNCVASTCGSGKQSTMNGLQNCSEVSLSKNGTSFCYGCSKW